MTITNEYAYDLPRGWVMYITDGDPDDANSGAFIESRNGRFTASLACALQTGVASNSNTMTELPIPASVLQRLESLAKHDEIVRKWA